MARRITLRRVGLERSVAYVFFFFFIWRCSPWVSLGLLDNQFL
jgi:hypothetical protein